MLSHIFAFGGIVLITIGFCWVLALALTIERLARPLPLNHRLRAEWARLWAVSWAKIIGAFKLAVIEKLPLHRVVSRAKASVSGGCEAVREGECILHKTVASGIYKALGTTAAGLAVAIPAYIAWHGERCFQPSNRPIGNPGCRITDSLLPSKGKAL